MKIDTIQVTVRDVYEGFVDDGENGVKGYGGMLDIRPPFQREFVYGAEKQLAVIDTIKKGFPLNVMYWVKTIRTNMKSLMGNKELYPSVNFCQERQRMKTEIYSCHYLKTNEKLF